jgi:NAD(P)-dependent dehydrogenase (short-subunit alcohol dehydrogenase family)
MSKVWFITGSSRGLGLAIAEAALKTGASVIATARKPEQLNHLVEKYGSDKVLPVALDVNNNEDALKAAKAGHEKFGRIDVVVNNAGYADVAAIEDISIESFRAQIETNYLGVVYVTKAVLPILRKQGSGHIFQVSSIGGRMGSPGLSAYQSAKWAVGGFSGVLTLEVAPLGIKVTVLEPGGMSTGWAGSSMKIPPISEPYQQIIGPFVELRKAKISEGWSPAEKVADVVLKLSEAKDPPVRILVGEDAVMYGGMMAESLAGSDKKWRDVSLFKTA